MDNKNINNNDNINRKVSDTIDNQPATGKYKYSNNTIKYYENLAQINSS